MLNMFDNVFDYNHDGKLDWMERASQLEFLDYAMRMEEEKDDLDWEDDDEF